MSLLGGRIEFIVGGVSDYGPVPVENISSANYAIDAMGRRWVRKKVLYTVHEPLLAEAIGWMLARELGIPIPGAAVTGERDDLSWLSEVIPNVTHWEPSRANFIENADDFGRVFALDAVLFNPDRHARNILLQTTDFPSVKAWSIDFGESLVGHPSDFAALGELEVPSPKNLARKLPIELFADGALAAAKLAKELNNSFVKAAVTEACEIVGENQGSLLLEALSARLERAPQLTERYLASIGYSP